MSKSSEAVAKFRTTKGNDRMKKIYYILVKCYDLPKLQANKMKFWGSKRIVAYLEDNNCSPVPHFSLMELWK